MKLIDSKPCYKTGQTWALWIRRVHIIPEVYYGEIQHMCQHMARQKYIWRHSCMQTMLNNQCCSTEAKMSSFLWNIHHWLCWKLWFWQLSVQSGIKMSSKWWHFYHYQIMTTSGAADKLVTVTTFRFQRGFSDVPKPSCCLGTEPSFSHACWASCRSDKTEHKNETWIPVD